MVPDVFQIIVKEKGVFTNVTSPSTKAKLRILFEVGGMTCGLGREAKDTHSPMLSFTHSLTHTRTSTLCMRAGERRICVCACTCVWSSRVAGMWFTAMVVCLRRAKLPH
jgi:fructose-1,6-bisphosphatase